MAFPCELLALSFAFLGRANQASLTRSQENLVVFWTTLCRLKVVAPEIGRHSADNDEIALRRDAVNV